MLGAMVTSLEVALSFADAAGLEADCYVVVDVLRATTTIATLFEAGLRDLLVVDDIDRARESARRDGRLLFGEVGGLAPRGFDHGNSPVEAAGAAVAGRGAVLFTTNGTVTLCGLAGRGEVAAGAIANADAIAGHLRQHQRVAIVCAGNARGQRFALEDLAAAGVIARAARSQSTVADMGDGAVLAASVAEDDERVRAFVSGSEHSRHLASLGLEADIGFALRRGTSRAVPVVVESGAGWAMLRDVRG